MGQPWPLFSFFDLLNTNILEKTVGFSEIRSRIVGVEGKHADHLTTTTALETYFLNIKRLNNHLLVRW